MTVPTALGKRIDYAKRLLTSKKFRYKEKRFVVEGIQVLTELFSGKHLPDYFIYDEQLGTSKPGQSLLKTLLQKGVSGHKINSWKLRAISDSITPQGIIAVVFHPDFPELKLETVGLRLIVCDRINDPGNLGTIIRIADAAGYSGVILGEGSVDPTNPKVVRATMASYFRIPHYQVGNLDQFMTKLHQAGVKTIATSCKPSARDYRTVFSELQDVPKLAIFMGSESQGLSPATGQKCQHEIHIPIYGAAESLNVAIATAIVVYEERRKTPVAD